MQYESSTFEHGCFISWAVIVHKLKFNIAAVFMADLKKLKTIVSISAISCVLKLRFYHCFEINFSQFNL